MIDLPFPTLASHLVLAGRVIALDAGNLMAASLGATAIGGGISAGGTLAGGSYAAAAGRAQNQAAQFEAGQIDSNAGQAIASGQRQMMDTEQRTRLAESSAIARAGASGVSADVGSPAAITGSIASRGSYQAMMDMFNGQSTATGLENRAAGVRYGGELAEMEGEEKQSASYLAAGGALASSAGGMASTYARFR